MPDGMALSSSSLPFQVISCGPVDRFSLCSCLSKLNCRTNLNPLVKIFTSTSLALTVAPHLNRITPSASGLGETTNSKTPGVEVAVFVVVAVGVTVLVGVGVAVARVPVAV